MACTTKDSTFENYLKDIFMQQKSLLSISLTSKVFCIASMPACLPDCLRQTGRLESKAETRHWM